MAKVIEHYTAVITGGATIYCYQRPDDTSPATRVYRGTEAKLPADYASRGRSQMLPVLTPVGGWMFYWNLSDITPVETFVTDPCTPPESLTLDRERSVLVIAGGDGTERNELEGFGVSWRERAANAAEWGAWSAETVSREREVAVTAASGRVRQYRVRTRGSAGSAYYSSFVVCQALVTCPTLEGVPVVEVPRNGAVTYCYQPLARVSCRAAEDGTARRLMRSVDGGAWALRKEFTQNLSFADQLPSLAAGTHTIRYRMESAEGAQGDEVSVQITIRNRDWQRDLSRGMVISSRKISHQAEIRELLSAVNAMRAYYGLDAVTLPGTVGRLGDWKPQMKALQTGINEARRAMDQQKHQWTSAPGWPTADIVLDIRHQSMQI